MSSPVSPSTPADSEIGADSIHTSPSKASTPRTEPIDIELVDVTGTKTMEENTGQNGDLADDMEGMDVKAKALMHLLKTSSVFVAIMADKMKKQQEDARAYALRQQQQHEATQTKEATASTERRETRAKGKHPDTTIGEGEEVKKEQSSTSPKPDRATREKSNRGRPMKAPANGTLISNYFQKANVEVTAQNSSVQKALEHATDELEANPTALGEQHLVATQQPKLVTGGKMRTYQLEGLEWLKSLWMNGLCGILADEMGLGKTVQAISLIAFFKEKGISGPFLIAAPLSTVSNWVNEFARWTPSIKTVLYHGSKDERARIRGEAMKLKNQKDRDFPVVCTSYEICMNDRKFLAQYQWKYIIVDEGHRLKNMNCRLIKELLTYNSANRLLITGTPLQNNITELWSLLHFLLPDIFNDLDSFESWFDFSSVLDSGDKADIIERRKRNLVTAMHAILKPFLLRRVKTDVETCLPKKREYILYAPLTSEQKDLYREILNGTGRKYLEEKAAERLLAKNESVSRSISLKRRADGSGRSTPNKSVKSSSASTPSSTTSSTRSRRRPKNYKELTDRDFYSQLNNLENGVSDKEFATPELNNDSELEEIQRAKTIKLAKKEISNKKLQNPLMQARLACNSPHNFYWPWGDDPSAVDETLVTASGKMMLLDRLVPRLLSNDHKILIFSQFKTQLDILQDWAIHLRSWNCCRIDGSISQAVRHAQIEAFNNDKDFKLFLLSTRAGGQGINLVAADTVILYDSDWNPQQDLQAQDRVHRIGQTRPVIVYRLATKGTVEQTLLQKADSKRRLERLVIQKGKFKSLLDSASLDEVEELKKAFGPDEFERFEAGADPSSILSDADLDILTDRTEEAYLRVERGLERKGPGFLAVETKRNDVDIMDEISGR